MNNIHRPFVFVALAACLATAPAAAKTFKWSSASDIPTWDIHSQNNALGNGVHAAVYESLLYYNKKFELEPVLATGWKQVSPTQVRLTLRQGVKFHDGAVFNADDAKFSLERAMTKTSNYGVYTQGIERWSRWTTTPSTSSPGRAEPGAAAPDDRAAHDGPRLGREEQVGRAQGHQDQGRELRPPQRQWHRPVHAQELGAGRQAGARAQPQLVGKDGQQRDRDRLHADQVRGDAHRGAAFGRGGHGAGPVACRT
jgi:hypothetical protein